MDLIEALQQAIENKTVEQFILEKKKEDKAFLLKTFWLKGGGQMTILNYLIFSHEEESTDLKAVIAEVLADSDLTACQPLHFALQHKKTGIIPLLLKAFVNASNSEKNPLQAYVNARDEEGYTLISRAIEAQNLDCLQELQACGSNLEQPSQGITPLHQAIKMNFIAAIELFIDAKVTLTNPCTLKKETPLLFAAHHGQINALSVLLDHIKPTLDAEVPILDMENADSLCAIDLLCERLQKAITPQEAIRGIAMLLCHGATAPRTEQWRHLLSVNRIGLLAGVIMYTKDTPHLSIKFVRAAHDKNNPLHDILYKDKSWYGSMRYFLGRPDGIASQFETLVFETERNNSESDDFGDSIDIDASENFNEEEIRFADFVRRYNQSIHVKTFFNPWSDMRWKLVQGEITTWRSVVNYSKENPHTRTAKIVSEICKLTLLERLNLDEDDVLLNKEISPF